MIAIDMKRALAALACAAALTLPAGAAELTLDTAHSQARFAVRHLAISTVEGRIPITAGTIATGENDVPTAISATLDVRGINTEAERRDNDLRSANWFDVEKFPTMTFVAKKIEAGAGGSFTVIGDLTFHGVTKSATLQGKVDGRLVDQRGRAHIGFSATTTIDRRDWGLTFAAAPGGNLIAGYDITIRLNVEGISKV